MICIKGDLKFVYHLRAPSTAQPSFLYHSDPVLECVPAMGTTGLSIRDLDHPRKSEPYGHVPAPSSFSSNRA